MLVPLVLAQMSYAGLTKEHLVNYWDFNSNTDWQTPSHYQGAPGSLQIDKPAEWHDKYGYGFIFPGVEGAPSGNGSLGLSFQPGGEAKFTCSGSGINSTSEDGFSLSMLVSNSDMTSGFTFSLDFFGETDPIYFSFVPVRQALTEHNFELKSNVSGGSWSNLDSLYVPSFLDLMSLVVTFKNGVIDISLDGNDMGTYTGWDYDNYGELESMTVGGATGFENLDFQKAQFTIDEVAFWNKALTEEEKKEIAVGGTEIGNLPAIPEPVSGTFLGMGIATMALRRRRAR